jgi:hypothetical protein
MTNILLGIKKRRKCERSETIGIVSNSPRPSATSSMCATFHPSSSRLRTHALKSSSLGNQLPQTPPFRQRVRGISPQSSPSFRIAGCAGSWRRVETNPSPIQ